MNLYEEAGYTEEEYAALKAGLICPKHTIPISAGLYVRLKEQALETERILHVKLEELEKAENIIHQQYELIQQQREIIAKLEKQIDWLFERR